MGANERALAFDHAALAREALEHHILPGYERFAAAAGAFSASAAALCQSPSAPALAATRSAARQALFAWGHMEHIRFGPITEQQRLDRLLFYPDPRGIGRKQITRMLAHADYGDLALDKLAHASVAVQGFTALDELLFGEGAQSLASGGAGSTFRCAYVLALARSIERIAAGTRDAWNGPYRETWLHPGPGNRAYLSVQEPTQALLRAYATELEIVRLQRLAPALEEGETPKEHAEPLLAQGGLGLPFLLADIEGVRDLLTAGGFLDPAVAPTTPERSAQGILGSIVTDLGLAQRSGARALALSATPFDDKEACAALKPMLYALKNAEETGRSALTALTGQSLGFNALDGD